MCRDLRIVDPLIPTPYPTALFIRERAMVVNFESIRMIIAADQVFVLSVPQPGRPLHCATFPAEDNPFVKDLVARLTVGQPHDKRSRLSRSSMSSYIDSRLPYELRALETVLAAVAKSLETEAVDLEKCITPALKRLLNKISRKNLDEVRNCKTALNKLMTRIAKIKAVGDLQDMYLARRARKEARKSAAVDGVVLGDDSEGFSSEEDEEASLEEETDAEPSRIHVLETPFMRDDQQQPAKPGMPGRGSPEGRSSLPSEGQGSQEDAKSETLSEAAEDIARQWDTAKHGGAHGGGKPNKWHQRVDKITQLLSTLDRMKAPGNCCAEGLGFIDPHDISACENLLEAYFMQIDFLLSRLKVLDERIDDSESTIEIELDHRRNELVALDLVVTAVAGSFAFISMIGGVYGMNLKNTMEESHAAFVWVTCISGVIAVFLFATVMLYARWKRLMFIPETMGGPGGRN
eukprot:jgi/Astpho2/7768/Aster-06062